MIVVDASVFVKLLKDEAESVEARALVDHMMEVGVGLAAPSIAIYETLTAALHVDVPLTVVGDMFDRFRALGLSIEEPTSHELGKAEEISRMSAPGGGRPALFDSIYHAMAIERGGTFVTADMKHLAKTKHLGCAVALADWRPA